MPHFADVFDHKMYFFQDDNVSIYRAHEVSDWCEANDINVFSNWLPQSPDLNLIENLWSEVERHLKKEIISPRMKMICGELLKKNGKKIPLETYVNLVDSMPRRVQACIDNWEYSTKY